MCICYAGFKPSCIKFALSTTINTALPSLCPTPSLSSLASKQASQLAQTTSLSLLEHKNVENFIKWLHCVAQAGKPGLALRCPAISYLSLFSSTRRAKPCTLLERTNDFLTLLCSLLICAKLLAKNSTVFKPKTCAYFAAVNSLKSHKKKLAKILCNFSKFYKLTFATKS